MFSVFDTNGVVLTAQGEGASPDTLGKPGQKAFAPEGVVQTYNAMNDTFGVGSLFHRIPGVSLAKPRSTPGCENDAVGVENQEHPRVRQLFLDQC